MILVLGGFLAGMALVFPMLDPQEEPVQPWKIEFRAELRKTSERYTFAFDGRTNLPAGTLLRLTVFYPEIREEIDPETGEKKQDVLPDYLFFKNYEAKIRVPPDGTIRHDLYRLRRRPFSLEYRARIQVLLEEQTEEIAELLQKSGVGDRIETVVPVETGEPGDFEKEHVESARLLERDLREVKELFDAIRARYSERMAGQPADGWELFVDEYTRRVRRLQDRNSERFAMFRVWIERIGGFKMEDLTDSLIFLSRLMEKVLRSAGDGKLLEELNRKIRNLEELYQQALEELQLDRPDAPALRKPVEELAKLVQTAADWAEKAAAGNRGEWDHGRFVLEPHLWDAVYRLGDESVAKTKQLHPYVVAVSDAFQRLLDAVDALGDPPEEEQKKAVLKEAAAIRDAMRELREFSGVN